MSYFKSDNAVRGIFGEKAYRKLVQLLDPCCGGTGGNGELVSPDPETFDFTPSARKTFLKYNAPLYKDVNLVIDVSLSFLGDTLIIMAKATGNHWNINLDSNFFYTKCGGDNSQIKVNQDGRVAMVFTFDGEKFVLTADNC